MTKLFRKRRRLQGRDGAFCKDVLTIWGLGTDGANARQDQAEAYINHYINLLQSNTVLVSSLGAIETPTGVFDLIDIVRTQRFQSIDTVCNAISTLGNAWTKIPLDCTNARQALGFALKLWLFSEPSLTRGEQPLDQCIQALYHSGPPNALAPAANIRFLSTDFSALSLTRKGGFYIVWTSDLSEHLTFVSRNQLRVFRHAGVLRRYQCGVENGMYPDGFLEETYRTMHLLYPCEDIRTSRRVRKIVKKKHVDIEATLDVEAELEKAMDENGRYDISNYAFYGPRLAEIQRRYNLAKPHRVEQWFFDRRQKQEWGALMVALIVFVLTVFFGIISSVTSIMQTWATFEALKK